MWFRRLTNVIIDYGYTPHANSKTIQNQVHLLINYRTRPLNHWKEIIKKELFQWIETHMHTKTWKNNTWLIENKKWKHNLYKGRVNIILWNIWVKTKCFHITFGFYMTINSLNNKVLICLWQLQIQGTSLIKNGTRVQDTTSPGVC
jgi:hypothetical protein